MDRFGNWKIARRIAEPRVRRLEVRRNRVVNVGFDAELGQALPQAVAVRGSNDEQVPRRIRPARHLRKKDRQAAERVKIARGNLPALGGSVIQIAQLDLEHGGLNL